MKLQTLRSALSATAILAISICASAFRTDTISVSGPGLAEPMPALVVTPDSQNPEDRFPTVYLLHGYGGGEYDWIGHQPRICSLADEYGMVIVTPGAGNTWYFDAPGKPEQQVETFIVQTLIPYIDANYPTIRTREKRAVAGLSMGGHGAYRLAIRHPQLFGAASTISGAVDIRPFDQKWKIAEIIGPRQQNPEVWDSATVAAMIPQIKEAGLVLSIDCGAGDFFAEVNRKLHQDLLDADIPHDYTSRPGNHSWKYWNNAILYQLLFFNEFFNRQ